MRSIHEVEPAGRETDVDLAPFLRIQPVERAEHGDPLSRGDRTAIAQDVHHGRAGFDSPGSPEDLCRKLEEVGVEADLALPMRDHRILVPLLDLAGKVAACDPGNAVSKGVGRL